MARKKPFLLLPFNLVSKPIVPTCNLPLKQIRNPGIHTFLKFQTILNIFKKSLYIDLHNKLKLNPLSSESVQCTCTLYSVSVQGTFSAGLGSRSRLKKKTGAGAGAAWKKKSGAGAAKKLTGSGS